MCINGKEDSSYLMLEYVFSAFDSGLLLEPMKMAIWVCTTGPAGGTAQN